MIAAWVRSAAPSLARIALTRLRTVPSDRCGLSEAKAGTGLPTRFHPWLQCALATRVIPSKHERETRRRSEESPARSWPRGDASRCAFNMMFKRTATTGERRCPGSALAISIARRIHGRIRPPCALSGAGLACLRGLSCHARRGNSPLSPGRYRAAIQDTRLAQAQTHEEVSIYA